ncbi:hypothetical protein [Streptomyces sp. NPDC001401]|uniref:hypothetical protein n=1 Tax=Streptomyces sp. NPDC001401 TaxID=3364570 RepID=UPI0036A81DD9
MPKPTGPLVATVCAAPNHVLLSTREYCTTLDTLADRLPGRAHAAGSVPGAVG